MEKADAALMAIPTPGEGERDAWVRIGMAYKAAGGDFDTWDAWSRRGDGYERRAARDTWNSMKADGGITEATLYHTAARHGWKDQERGTGRGAAPAQSSRRGGAPADIRREIDEAAFDEKETGEARAYLRQRGFTDATIDRFNIGYCHAFTLAGTREPRVIIPYPGEDYYTARRISPAGDEDGRKYLYPPKARAGGKRAFNAPALTGGAETVFVTEGQLDAMAAEQEGGAAIGSNEPPQMLAALAAAGDAMTARRFVIIPDADGNGAGDAKAAKMAKALREAGQAAFIRRLPEGVHDCADSIENHPGQLRAWIAETPRFLAEEREREQDAKRREFDALTGAGRLADFWREIRENPRKATPTGFPRLDRLLDGGLWEGLYIIGAISSLGKTTFALQMIDQMAKAGRRCLVFSLEMSAAELMAKSISRLTDSCATWDANKKTARGILAGDRYTHYSEAEKALIESASERYKSFARNVCIVEGWRDMGTAHIRQTAERCADAYGESPVVLVDYLQILNPADPRATDKQNADRAVKELRLLARDLRTPVIAVSSFNRENYGASASMVAFKESGAIEYSADVLMAMQLRGVGARGFDAEKAKTAIPREVELVILKNRSAQTGGRLLFHYDARFNVFREQEGDAPANSAGYSI